MNTARQAQDIFKRGLFGFVLALIGALPGLGVAADRARLDHAAALTVVFEVLSDWPEALPLPQFGLFAVYAPDAALRASGNFVPERPFVIMAQPGDRLSFAVRLDGKGEALIQAAAPGIDLFTALGRPATGDVTARIGLLDAFGAPVPASAYPPLDRLVRVTIH